MTGHNRNISQKAFKRLSPEEQELWELREQQLRHDERMNEPMTRGAILEAIELASYSAPQDKTTQTIFTTLKTIFE